MIILHDYPPFFNSGSDISGIIEVYLSIFHIPNTIVVFRQTGIIKVNFSVLQIPPAILVLCQTVIVEINFSVRNLPPTVFVFGDRV